MTEEELDNILNVGLQRPIRYSDIDEEVTPTLPTTIHRIRQDIEFLRSNTEFLERINRSIERNRKILRHLADS